MTRQPGFTSSHQTAHLFAQSVPSTLASVRRK